LLVSLTNPKLILFFLVLFPPFIQVDRPVLPQLVLVATFSLMSFIIHCSYAGAATVLSARLTSDTALARLQRAAGALFLVFATLLLGAALGSPGA
jgi:threonine/homoserine/homoserine lactone efflux protein